MPESFFEKLKLCLNPAGLVPLVCESFPRKELVRLMASAGVVYPGIRMETLRPEELASGWVEDAWKDPGILAGLVKALDKAHEKDIERVRLASPDEMERMPGSVADICRQREISGLIWALLRDERADAALVRRFLESFYRLVDKGAAAFKKMERFDDHLWQGKLNKKETDKVRGMLVDLAVENKELKRDRQKTARDQDKMTRQIDDLKKKAGAGQAEIAVLKNDLAGLRKEAARKDTLIREFEHKVKTISQGEEELLRRRIHGLERNERKLQHEIAELNDKLASARFEVQTGDGRYRELQKTFQEERVKKERLEQDIKRLALNARPLDGQTAVRDQAGPAPAGKTFFLPKDKGRRLGVFVDTRHLWQASRFLQQKIDYQKLLDFIVLDRHLVKAVAYVMTAPDIDSGGFLAMLEKNGFHARFRPFVRWPDGSIHGGWGAGIAADVISFSEKLSPDIIHLVSGNADFTDLLKLLKARGLRTEVSGFRIDTVPEIERAADESISFGAEIFRDSARGGSS